MQRNVQVGLLPGCCCRCRGGAAGGPKRRSTCRSGAGSGWACLWLGAHSNFKFLNKARALYKAWCELFLISNPHHTHLQRIFILSPSQFLEERPSKFCYTMFRRFKANRSGAPFATVGSLPQAPIAIDNMNDSVRVLCASFFVGISVVAFREACVFKD